MDLTLITLFMTGRATVGVLDVPGCGSLSTIERPWVPDETEIYGKPFVSCLPEGEYKLEKLYSPTFTPRYGHNCYYITCDDVPARKPGRHEEPAPRWGTLFHRGNEARNVKGCVAVGLSRGHGRREWVNNSRLALHQLYDWLDANPGPHTLTIERSPVLLERS